MAKTTYRDYHIEYQPKPIPTRKHDWNWTHEDYDGPGDPRCGTAASEAAAKIAVDEMEWELADELDDPTEKANREGKEVKVSIPTD